MSVKASNVAASAVLFISGLFFSADAHAARFEVVDDEVLLCVLSFQKGFNISAAQGGGSATPIWVSLNEVENAPSGKELRLDIDTGMGKSSFLGGVGDYTGRPEFEVPLSLIDSLSRVARFTYRLDERPVVVINDHATSAQVRKFRACMSRGGN